MLETFETIKTKKKEGIYIYIYIYTQLGDLMTLFIGVIFRVIY